MSDAFCCNRDMIVNLDLQQFILSFEFFKFCNILWLIICKENGRGITCFLHKK